MIATLIFWIICSPQHIHMQWIKISREQHLFYALWQYGLVHGTAVYWLDQTCRQSFAAANWKSVPIGWEKIWWSRGLQTSGFLDLLESFVPMAWAKPSLAVNMPGHLNKVSLLQIYWLIILATFTIVHLSTIVSSGALLRATVVYVCRYVTITVGMSLSLSLSDRYSLCMTLCPCEHIIKQIRFYELGKLGCHFWG